MKPAYECTIALVFLTPSYRKQKYCVKELNTFMSRKRQGDDIRVVPVLWGVDNVKGYHEEIDKLTWIRMLATKMGDELQRLELSSKCRCLIIFHNMPHPRIVHRHNYFFPSKWSPEEQQQVAGILLCTSHPKRSFEKLGGPFVSMVEEEFRLAPDRIPKLRNSWRECAPESNLGLGSKLSENLVKQLSEFLSLNGQIAALVNRTNATDASKQAIQFARIWTQNDYCQRFGLALEATDEGNLRESYLKMICHVIHADKGYTEYLGNHKDLSLRTLADEFLFVLSQLPRQFLWILVYTNVNERLGSCLSRWFFSRESNWLGSRGRFLVASSTHDLSLGIPQNIQEDAVEEDEGQITAFYVTS